MPVETHRIEVSTRGGSQVVDLTDSVRRLVRGSDITDGLANVCVVGSTAGITTTEFEPGLATRDLAAAFERLAPRDGEYLHEQTWHDDNGHSHVCASMLGPSITVPLSRGELVLGTWQQIVLIDFDTRPRQRTIVISLVGDAGAPSA
ncbi:MAG: YjbQ family protein [Phycisphaerales bacterium]|nr:YjbQ family protein [Phycisphaerales bacterium]